MTQNTTEQLNKSLRFNPTSAKAVAYEVFDGDRLVFTIKRVDTRWVARDIDGVKYGKPDQYRHDLFERVEMDYFNQLQ